jgi:hypothetical protein
MTIVIRTIGYIEIIAAEKEYSQGRIDALSDEWSATYPNLSKLVNILRKFPKAFKFDYLLKKKSDINTIANYAAFRKL